MQYYEQTSDMMVDTVNENVKEEDEEDETEDGSMFEAMFDSEQENRPPVTNIRNPQHSGNWTDMNSLTDGRGGGGRVRGGTNNRDGRLNTECEINNRSAANLRSLNIPSVIGRTDTLIHTLGDTLSFSICLCQSLSLFPTLPLTHTHTHTHLGTLWDQPSFSHMRTHMHVWLNTPLPLPPSECQYNQDHPKDDNEEEEDEEGLEEGARGGRRRGRPSDGSGSSRRSSLAGDDADFAQKVHRLQTAKIGRASCRERV